VPNYVEPFFGSGAVLLGRPTEPQTETVNDLDCYLANFWRALRADPDAVAEAADWPVNEADILARHRWLLSQEEFRQRIRTDAEYYDPRIAGWWVWGCCQWIGSGWCDVKSYERHKNTRPQIKKKKEKNTGPTRFFFLGMDARPLAIPRSRFSFGETAVSIDTDE
jgi:hypothetical protein